MNDSTHNPIPVLYLDNTSTFGGAINSLLYLLRAIDKSSFKPVLVTAQPEKYLQEKFNFIQWAHVNIRRSWVDNHIYKKVLGYRFLSSGMPLKVVNLIRFFYWIIFITIPEAVRYFRIGRKHQVRLVHLNNIFGSQLAGILAAKLLRVPCVAHLRDFEEVDFITKLFAKMIDYHIAISEVIKDNLLKLGVFEEKVSLIHDSIDLQDFDDTLLCDHLRDEFCLSGKEKLFGIFGRIIPWKGTKEFVHAAAIVIRSNPEAIAFIVGDCSDGDKKYQEEIEELIAQYGLKKKFILTGFRKDVPSLMQLMDVVVHASIKPEPFGMVIIEAMAMAKPVVASKIGAPLDIIEEGRTGFLVAPGNAMAMAGAVSRLLDNRELAVEMGKNGRSRVTELFSKERYARQVEVVYAKLVSST